MSKQYTRKEVADTKGKGKTLIILHDKVYDVTDFLNEHPGGEEILMDHGGQDGSDDFDDVGHSVDAFELKTKYMVGELVESERSNKAPKESWKSSYSKKGTEKPDGGIPPSVVMAVLGVLVAIVYFVYL